MKKTVSGEREEHIRAWEASGLSKTAYAEEQGIKRNTFYRWHREFRGNETPPGGFIEINLPIKRVEKHGPTASEIGLLLENGYRLNIPPNFDPATVMELVSLLEAR